jgi:hypothetical protein
VLRDSRILTSTKGDASILQIRQVETPDDIQRIKELIEEYSEWVQREVDKVDDLSSVPAFSEYKAEFSTYPGVYGPPTGRLLLATDDDQPAGCVALKKFGEGRVS